jgi:SAM-dependent methyltransferase
MKPFYLRHDPASFWAEYWKEAKVDPPHFIDLDIYPIHPTIKHLDQADSILECGFGGGRVIRHLLNNGFNNVVGVEYDLGAAIRLNAAQPANTHVGDVRALAFRDATFDASMAFGVLGGLHHDTDRALHELIRVTKPGGLVIVSLMIDNVARQLQALINRLNPGNKKYASNFYAWMDTDQGWRKYLQDLGLHVIERSYMVSRYNFYYWTSLLRKRNFKFDHAYARVCDRGFALNPFGEFIFRLTKSIAPQQFAGAALYVCRTSHG